jgi:hypothetical protein
VCLVNPLSCIAPNASFFITLLCIMPDNFSRQGESSGAPKGEIRKIISQCSLNEQNICIMSNRMFCFLTISILCYGGKRLNMCCISTVLSKFLHGLVGFMFLV